MELSHTLIKQKSKVRDCLQTLEKMADIDKKKKTIPLFYKDSIEEI